LPKLKELKSSPSDPLAEQFKNIDVMEESEAFDLVERLNKRSALYLDSIEDEVEHARNEFVERQFTAARHGLNYAKLYHGLDGGYSMEKLKKVLKRIKDDVKDNLHPFIDPEADGRVENQLKKILKLRIEERGADEAAQEDAGDDEEKPKTAEQYVLDEINDDEEKEIAKELFNFVNERRAKERAEDFEAGEEWDEDIALNDADIAEIEKLYIEENGLHLADIEDEEEYLAAWIEWVQTKIQVRRKKRTVTYLDKKVAELKVKRPELSAILDELQGQDYSESLVGGEWIPDTKNYFKEMDRIEANIGRYPVGFRHYENWQNYSMRYEGKTMEDYSNDRKYYYNP
jgi:hypothetical protein